jgi:hypothetical protein
LWIWVASKTKEILSILITDLKQKVSIISTKKNILDHFRLKIIIFSVKKKLTVFFLKKLQKKLTLPKGSKGVIGKSQEIWSWLVHPP